MFGNSTSDATLTDMSRWSVLFAREADRDPDFDETFDEEFDENEYQDSDNRPPNRRPLMWILILLLVVGGGYVAVKSGMFGKPGLNSTGRSSETIGQPLLTTEPNQRSSFTSVPTPRYQEGQPVSIIPRPGLKMSAVSLFNDASGTQPGPTIQTDESLTVLDGEFVNKTWIYNVRAASGKTGWIAEHRLQAKP